MAVEAPAPSSAIATGSHAVSGRQAGRQAPMRRNARNRAMASRCLWEQDASIRAASSAGHDVSSRQRGRYSARACCACFSSSTRTGGATAALGLAKGDTLQLVVGQRRVPLSVAGILPGSALRGQAALVDIATAQWRFGRLGELNHLDIRVARDADRAVMVQRIQALLPPGAHAAPVEE